jgi:1,4-dihydroxy-2-naphthoate octaprenyltransferase
MARPLILSSVVLVYLAGLLMASAEGHAWPTGRILWALAALMGVSLAAHYANEYADVETDRLAQRTLYSGGSGVLPSGRVPPSLARQAAWVCLIGGLGIGALGLILGQVYPLTFLLLVLGAAGSWWYSLPPFKLAWRGWGELANGLLGGLIYLYAYVAVAGHLPLGMIAAVLPFTLLNINNLLATTWADRAADKRAGKLTLATRWSIPALRRLYALLALSAFGLLPWVLPGPVALASLAALPMAVWGWWTYTRLHSPYPTSNTMVVMLLAQMAAWKGLIAF